MSVSSDYTTHELLREIRDLLKSARATTTHEEPPVDPLLIEARDLIAKQYREAGTAAAIREGRWDNGTHVETALLALKRGIELAKSEQSL